MDRYEKQRAEIMKTIREIQEMHFEQLRPLYAEYAKLPPRPIVFQDGHVIGTYGGCLSDLKKLAPEVIKE